MATMIPGLPVAGMPTSEAKVYRALQALPDEYRVYHALSHYAGPSAGRAVREGESDFLVLHPEHGLLVVEVKGGGIRYDGRERRWSSVGSDGVEHPIQDPFAQAQRNVKTLMAEIQRRSPPTVPTSFAHGSAVAFPDCDYAPPNEPINAPADLVLDASDLAGDLERRLLAIFDYWTRDRTPRPERLGKSGVKKLGQHVLAPHFELFPSLSAALAWDERLLTPFAEEQRVCLDFLALNRRARVEGVAGSGKTIIACELARQLASEGKRVLFLCFNLPLASLLRRRCEEFDGLPIWAGSYHQLCREWARKAGLGWTEPGAEQASEFWINDSSLLLLDASERLPERFDALIVDEAQDFYGGWWSVLLDLLADRESCPIALFSDSRQDIWARGVTFPERHPVFPLRANRRNTRAIARFAARFAGQDVRLPPESPEGEEPQVIRYTSPDDERLAVERLLHRLLNESPIPLASIVLIGTHRMERSFLADRPTLLAIPVEAMDDESGTPTAKALRYVTLYRFKGLEADVVILCDVDGNEKSCGLPHLYVACSRARLRLYVLAARGAALP